MTDDPDDCAALVAAGIPRGGPVFFQPQGRSYLPQEVCRSPWNPGALNGVAVAGLLMHAAEQVEAPGVMLPAHITIDILRPVPFAATLTRAIVTRPGHKIQMVETHLLDGETVTARARVLRVREATSPFLEQPVRHPSPEDASRRPFLDASYPLAALMEAWHVAEGPGRIGAGSIWTRLLGDLVSGVRTSPLVHAVMLSDFGNGISQPVDPRQWSFANVDISVHMARRPVGEWLLADAEAMLHGRGVGLTDMVLADRSGPFGRAHQTLFIAPREPRSEGH
jgi:hypothetical protein